MSENKSDLQAIINDKVAHLIFSLTIGPSPLSRYDWWLICTIAGRRYCREQKTNMTAIALFLYSYFSPTADFFLREFCIVFV